VFRAKVASVPTAGQTYLEIAYNTVSLGSHTLIQVGQTLIISPTADHTDYLYIGRVADAATASVIPINESAYPLSTSFYVTVLDEYREFQAVRAGDLIDGRTSYQNVPPAIKNLRSAYVLWSTASTATLSLSPVAVAMAHGATIDPDTAYHWVFPDTVTYADGDEDTREIEIEVPQGHVWGRLEVVDSLDTPHWMVFEIFVDNPNAPALALTNADRLSLTRNLTGHHCTFTAYKNVKTSDLIDGQRMTVVRWMRYSNGDPNLDPVAFVGYLAKETNETRGPNDKSVSFDLAGLWERAGQLAFNAIAIRHRISPSAWDEMAYPTIQRSVWHILSRYSVVPHLAAFDFDVTDNTWFGGDRNVSSNTLGDACAQAMSEICAALVGNPSGEMIFRRWAFFLTAEEKNALDEVATLNGASDMRDLNFARSHDEPVGRVVIGFAGYYTDGSAPKIGRAKAPTVTLGVSPEVREFNNQLMRADQSEADLLTEAADRAAAQLGVANIPYTLTGTVKDGFAWMTPSVFQWLPVILATGLTARGRTMSSVRHLLVGVTIDYDTRFNTHTNKFELMPEPGSQSAMVWANLTPAAQPLTEIITPLQSAYPGLRQPSSLNAPDTTTRRRFSRQSMGGMGLPYPADQSGEDAQRTPPNGSRQFDIGFWVSDAVNAGFTSVSDEDYDFIVEGSAQLTADSWLYADIYSGGNAGFAQVYSGSGVGAQSVLTGDGYAADSGNQSRITIWYDLGMPVAIASLRVLRTDPMTAGDTNQQKVNALNSSDVFIEPPLATGSSALTDQTFALNTTTDKLGIDVVGDFDADGEPVPGAIYKVVFGGTGANPFGVTGEVLYGDMAYVWNQDANGNPINIRLNPDIGLKIDNAAITPPLFSKTHRYAFKKVGTGSQFSLVFYSSNYTPIQRVPLSVTISGPNAGT
jgi:hypothetical protein